MSNRNDKINEVESSTGPIHRIGMKVVTQEEWIEAQRTQGSNYERNKKREFEREFDKRQKLEWKSGLEQKSERDMRAEEALDIITDSLSSSRVRSDLINVSKQQRRWDDPLDKMVKSDVVRDDIKPKSIFQAPSNRFRIAAGYRWDGVVRGNDFEQKWFHRQNESKGKSTLE